MGSHSGRKRGGKEPAVIWRRALSSSISTIWASWQWVLALATSGEGVPQFLQPLDGNVNDKRALLQAGTALTQQLQESGDQIWLCTVGLNLLSESEYAWSGDGKGRTPVVYSTWEAARYPQGSGSTIHEHLVVSCLHPVGISH
jgi:hypothetical protein